MALNLTADSMPFDPDRQETILLITASAPDDDVCAYDDGGIKVWKPEVIVVTTEALAHHYTCISDHIITARTPSTMTNHLLELRDNVCAPPTKLPYEGTLFSQRILRTFVRGEKGLRLLVFMKRTNYHFRYVVK